MDWVTTGRYNKYMANQWFKFYGGEYLSDSKIGRLTDSERSCWLTLLCMTSMTDDGIIKFLSIDDLLIKSGIKWDPYNEGAWEKCQGILTKLSGMKMIKVDTEQSIIQIINWDKRQERTAQTPYERVKKHRDSMKRENVIMPLSNDNEGEEKNVKKAILHKAGMESDNENDNGDNENDNDRIEENRIEENRIEESKTQYGESGLVKMTPEEYQKLIDALTEPNANLLIEELDDYLGTMTPRKAELKYTSHYKALRGWARKKYQDHSKTLSSKRKIV